MLFKKPKNAQERLYEFLGNNQKFKRNQLRGDKPFHMVTLTKSNGQQATMIRTDGEAFIFVNGEAMKTTASNFDAWLSNLVDL